MFAGVILGASLAATVLLLDARHQVREWQAAPAPSRPLEVFTAPIRVEPGDAYALHDLWDDMLAAHLEPAQEVRRPGQMNQAGRTWEAWLPEPSPPGAWRPGRVKLRWDDQGRILDTFPDTPLTLPPSLLAEIGDLDRKRDPTTLDDLPPHLPAALLAIEDTRFLDHPGVDPVGVARALWSNLTSDGLQGGSTLTQQIAKNVFLSRERTWRRKLHEIFFATALEWELDKRTLLSLYLSEVYLGHVGGRPLHGVEQGARAWFGRSAQHVSVSEAATLVGAIASPNVYSPLRDPEASLRRRNTVLTRMEQTGALSHRDAEAARAAPLNTVSSPPTAAWRLPWVVDAALAALDAERAGMGSGVGLTLHTTAQPHWQRAAERGLRRGLDALAEAHPGAADAQAALVGVDARSGDVITLVGGRSYADSPFHRATRAQRPAGSTVKGLVLLTALSRDPQLHPASLIEDAPLTLSTDQGPWSPRNIDGAFRGPISLRQALLSSRNIPFVALGRQIGWSALRDFYRDAGLTGATTYPSAALGAFDVTPWQLAGAYTVFPAEGRAARPRLLLRVDEADGAPSPHKPPEQHLLADPIAAALTTTALQAAAAEGTARALRTLRPDLPIGAKTGTSDRGRDAWVVAFDGQTTWALWVGRDQGRPLDLTGGEAAVPVFRAIAEEIGWPRVPLTAPTRHLTSVQVCERVGTGPCPDCARLVTGWFRRGTAPEGTDRCEDSPPATAPSPEPPTGPLAPAPVAQPRPREPGGRWDQVSPARLPDIPAE